MAEGDTGVQNALFERVVAGQDQLRRAFDEHETVQQQRLDALSEQIHVLGLTVNTVVVKVNGMPDEVRELQAWRNRSWGMGKLIALQCGVATMMAALVSAAAAVAKLP